MTTNISQSNKLLELDSLIEFSQLINSKTDLNFILGNILYSIMGKMMISKAVIFLKENQSNLFRIKTAKGISFTEEEKSLEIKVPTEANFRVKHCKEAPDVLTRNKLQYCFKIYFERKLIGLLCIGDKIKDPGSDLTTREIVFIETLLSLSAAAIEHSMMFDKITELNKSLTDKVSQLNSLFEMSKEFNSNLLEKEKIVKLLSYTLLGTFGIKDFLIFNVNGDDFEIIADSRTNAVAFTPEELIELKNFTNPVLINELPDSRLLKKLSINKLKLIFPTFYNNNLSNIVILGEKLNKSEFTKQDLNFLESIINLSAISIDNSDLFKQFIEKKQIEKELDIAREIQLALLPEKLPEIEGYDVFATNIPVHQVGGDYYDVIKLSDTKFAFVIADVTGKGTPAAMLMANVQSAVHSLLRVFPEIDLKLEDISQKLNSLIYDNTTSDKFITFFWGILDTQTHRFKYINAGHNTPYMISGDRLIKLDKGGLIMGIIKDGTVYESGEIDLNENDLIYMYTDGVTEARNSSGEEFSDEKLIELLNEHSHHNSEKISRIILEEIEKFAGGEKQSDDLTLITLKRQSHSVQS